MGIGAGQPRDRRRDRRSAACATSSSWRPGLLAAQAMQTGTHRVDLAALRRLQVDQDVRRDDRHARHACATSSSGQLDWLPSAIGIVTGIFARDRRCFGAVTSPLVVRGRLARGDPDRPRLRHARWRPGRRRADARRPSRPLPLHRSRRCSCSAARSSRSTSCPRPPAGRLADAALPRRRPDPRLALGHAGPAAAAIHVAYSRASRRSGFVAFRTLPPAAGARDRACGGAARILPWPSAAAAPCTLLERNPFIFRRAWMVIVRGFFEPLFYLLGIGFGLGALVGDRDRARRTPSPTRCSSRRPCWPPSSMNGAIYDSRSTCSSGCATRRPTTACSADPAQRGRHRPRRGDLGAHPRRALRARLPRGDVRLRPRPSPLGRSSRCRPRC